MQKLIIMLALVSLTSACGCSRTEPRTESIPTTEVPVSAAALTPVEPQYLQLNHLEYDKKEAREVQAWANLIKSNRCKNHPLCEFILSTAKPKDPRFTFNFKNLAQLQTVSLTSAYRSLKSVKEAQLIKKVDQLVTGSCPRTLSAAALIKIESQLPAPEAWNAMTKLYNAVMECPVDAQLESVYLRMALLFFTRNQLPLAQIAIKNALALPVKDEQSRILYWGGVLLEDKTLLQSLIKLRPYTLHAILASDLLQIDLWDQLKNRPVLMEQRQVSTFTEAYEKLLFYKQVDAAFELVNDNLNAEFIKKDPQYLFYLVRLMDLHGRTDYTIRLVSRIGQLYPDDFNIQFIQIAYKNTYLPLFETYAPETDPYLMLALSKQESGFYARATSRVRAKGLMQLMPATARHLSRQKSKDLYNVDNNVYLGSLYFRNLYQRYNQVELALAAYNAGPMRVDEWTRRYQSTSATNPNALAFLDLIPFKETRQYVSTILRNNYFYRQLFEEPKTWAIESKVIHLRPTEAPGAPQEP